MTVYDRVGFALMGHVKRDAGKSRGCIYLLVISRVSFFYFYFNFNFSISFWVLVLCKSG